MIGELFVVGKSKIGWTFGKICSSRYRQDLDQRIPTGYTEDSILMAFMDH